LAAESIMLYIYDLTDIALMMKAIGFVSSIALATWLFLKF